jgi:hypothetical protein
MIGIVNIFQLAIIQIILKHDLDLSKHACQTRTVLLWPWSKDCNEARIAVLAVEFDCTIEAVCDAHVGVHVFSGDERVIMARAFLILTLLDLLFNHINDRPLFELDVRAKVPTVYSGLYVGMIM